MPNRWLKYIDYAHLTYLGLLPGVATLVLLALYGTAVPGLIWFGGIVAVSVYLAVVAGYTALPRSPLVGLVMLLDGPAFVLLGQFRGSGGGWPALAVESYLVDGLAIWIGILVLAMNSPLPNQGQRVGSVFFMLVALGTTLLLFWPYFDEVLWGQWERLGWLVVGFGEGIVFRYRVLERDQVVRDLDFSPWYILLFLFVWMGLMFIALIEPVQTLIQGRFIF